MHPRTLDDFVTHPDHDVLFSETREHMAAYLQSVTSADRSVPLFVCGFLEPPMNPAGVFFPARKMSNFKHFVRSLNDALVDWCAANVAYFVDADEIASVVGKGGVDESASTFLSHRGPLDREYDDNNDRAYPTVPLEQSFDIRSGKFSVAVLREVLHRLVTLNQRGRIKAVIVDLDNTLWRGLASDGEIGTWNGRPQGLVEALKILKQRGIFIAIASKNDETYIREHWEEILYMWPEVPLGCRLSLEDFDAVRIDFRPKSETVGELLRELNVLPDSVVFIDDNPLEREEVQAAFPEMRVLGAELNYVRRELLHSPFTQTERFTEADRVRARTAKQQVRLQEHVGAGTAQTFLDSLHLRLGVVEVLDPDSPAGARAVQLINKTNQWSLNGERVAEAGLAAGLAAGRRLFVADARDAASSYGIIAAALVDGSAVTHLVVSCRVIGMGIDDAFVHELIARCGALELSYSDSGRNRAAAASLARWTGEPAAQETVVARVEAPGHIALVSDGPGPDSGIGETGLSAAA